MVLPFRLLSTEQQLSSERSDDGSPVIIIIWGAAAAIAVGSALPQHDPALLFKAVPHAIHHIYNHHLHQQPRQKQLKHRPETKKQESDQ